MKKFLSFITDFSHKIMVILLMGLITKNVGATANITANINNTTNTTTGTNDTNTARNIDKTNTVVDTKSTVVDTKNTIVDTNEINTETVNTNIITATPINTSNNKNNESNKHIHSKRIQDKCMKGLTIFKETGECISHKNLTVLYVLESNIDLYNSALVHEEDTSNTGLTMLIVDNADRSYYDGQIIKLPQNKCFRIIGTYRYPGGRGHFKTVPVVVIDQDYNKNHFK